MTADLSRLSDGERRVLALLAIGHTAKSAAAETGLSVNAVNERLREARRKTGVGSSRELARLVGAQENRDEKIGAAAIAPAVHRRAAPAAPSGWRRRLTEGAVPMTLLLAAAAIAVAVIQQPTAPAPMVDQNVQALHDQVRAETPDAGWTRGAAQKLKRIYAPVRGVGTVTVICGATMCEVAGSITPGNEAIAAELLQGDALHRRVRDAGFGPELMIQFATEAARKGATFVTYHRR